MLLHRVILFRKCVEQYAAGRNIRGILRVRAAAARQKERERFMKIRRSVMAAVLLCLRRRLCTDTGWTRRRPAGIQFYVNRKTNIVNVVDAKSGKVVRAMYCSTGRNYSTIRGTYTTVSKMRWHALYGGVYGQYCMRIHGPYLFHSVPYYRTSKNQLETKEYNKLGTQASDGCIRLAVVDAKWLYDNCGVGTKVVIGDTRKLQKPDRKKLKISTASRTGWDPTDPESGKPVLSEA